MPKTEIVNTDEATVRVDGKALAIKVGTMIVATAATMAAVHVVEKRLSRKS